VCLCVCSTDGIDYRVSLGTLTLSQSQNVKCFQVTIVDDDLPEPEENFTLVLSSDSALSNISQLNSTTVVIQENDCKSKIFMFWHSPINSSLVESFCM